jgi:hypothetical protein
MGLWRLRQTLRMRVADSMLMHLSGCMHKKTAIFGFVCAMT